MTRRTSTTASVDSPLPDSPRSGDARRATCVVVAGGDAPAPILAGALPPGVFVIAADSGYDHARTLGLTVGALVGDLDSISADGLAAAVAAGVAIDRHPTDKDETDLELALRSARDNGHTSILVLGGPGGRFDHLLANVMLLASPLNADLTITARLGRATVHVLHGPGNVVHRGDQGDLVTLLPVFGPARSVHTRGLRWRLIGDDLTPGSTRGVSNEMTGSDAAVSLELGTLLVIAPERDAEGEVGSDSDRMPGPGAAHQSRPERGR